MLEQVSSQTPSDDEIVLGFFESLKDGRVVDALNVFATDALLRDDQGRDHRGIKEIAASFANRRKPSDIFVEDIKHQGDRVVALVRLKGGKRCLHSFHLKNGRVHSLRVRPLQGERPRSRKGRP
jgi:hypothetical protein